MKYIILSLGLFATSVMAQEAPRPEPSFPEIKSMVLKSIDKRQQILMEEKNCVNQAQEKEILKGCFKNANEKRREMAIQIRIRPAQRPQP